MGACGVVSSFVLWGDRNISFALRAGVKIPLPGGVPLRGGVVVVYGYKPGVLKALIFQRCFSEDIPFALAGGMVILGVLLGLRPARLRCAGAVGFAYRRVTFFCMRKRK